MLDLAPEKIAAMETAVRTLNDTIAKTAKADPATREAIRADVQSVDGMARFDDGNMPWHADRPALAAYDALASDSALPEPVRSAARDAKDAVGALVLAHKESRAFQPYHGASYTDAAGPTAHLPTSPGQIDPWAPQVSETKTAFFKATHGARLDRTIA